MNVERMLSGYVLVERDPREEKIGLILLAPSAQENLCMGTVIAVGPGEKDKDGKVTPMSLKVNDKILFNRYSGQSIKIDGKDYLAMTEPHVYAVIEEEA